MEDLRSWHEVPGIAHFCSLFRIAFDLTDFDIEDLENGFIASESEEGSPFLFELISRLLCGCYGRTDIYYYNFEVYLKDILKHRYELEADKPNPLKEPESTFRSLDLYTKVQVVCKLCDFRLDAEDVAEKLKGYDGDNMRLEPLGKDSAGATYWYFYGVRLYKENAEPPEIESKPIFTKKNKEQKCKNRQKKLKKINLSKKKKENKMANIRRSCRISQKEIEEEEDSCNEEDSIEDKESETSASVEKLKETQQIQECPSGPPERWHLICTTLEDWENLVACFKNSKVKCEKNLYKVITESFLPEIPNILESWEKERKKRLLEMAPRRSSNRLESKRREQEEQDKILAEAQEIEDEQRAEFEEERRKQLESERLEQESKEREERQRAREDRANRLVMREERARLVAEGKEIPPEMLYFGNSKDKDDVNEKSEFEDVSYAGMLKVVEAVRAHKDAWPFCDPVDDNVAPGYTDIIKKPMDLSTIEKKIHERRYISRNKFMSDFRLVFHNCRRYNGTSSTFAGMAANVEHFYRKSLKKFLPVEEFDSDEDFRIRLSDTPQCSRTEQKFRPKRAASSRAKEQLHDTFHDDLFNSSLHGQSSSSYDDSSSDASYEKPAKQIKFDDNVESKIMEALVATKRAQASADKVSRFKVSRGDESNSLKMPVLLSHGTLLKNAEKRPISWIIDGKKVPMDVQDKEMLTERFTKKISTTGTFAALLEKNRQMQLTHKNVAITSQRVSQDQSPSMRNSVIVIKKSGEKSVTMSPSTENVGLSHILTKRVNFGPSSVSTPLPAPISLLQTGIAVPKTANSPINESIARGQLHGVAMSPTGQKFITVIAPQVGQPKALSSCQMIKTSPGSGNVIQVIDGKLVIGGKATGIPVSQNTKIVYKGSAPAENLRIPELPKASAKIISPSIQTVPEVENMPTIGGFINTQLQTCGNSAGLTSTQLQTVRNEMDASVTLIPNSAETATLSGYPIVTSTVVLNLPVNTGEHAISESVSSNTQFRTPQSITLQSVMHGTNLLNTQQAYNKVSNQNEGKQTLLTPVLICHQSDNNNHKKEYSVETNQNLRSETSVMGRKELVSQNSFSVYDRIVDLPTSVEVIDQNHVTEAVIGHLDSNNSVVFGKQEVSPSSMSDGVDQHLNRKRKNIFESFGQEKTSATPNKLLRPTLQWTPPCASQMNTFRTCPKEETGSINLSRISQPSIWNMETKKFMKPTDILNSLSTKLGNKSIMSASLFPGYKCDTVGNTAGLLPLTVNGSTVSSSTTMERFKGSPAIIALHDTSTEDQLLNPVHMITPPESQS